MKKILGVFVLGAMLAVPAMASAANPLPEGFIALSDSRMDWAEAKAFCEQQGGRLPLIGGSESLGWDDAKKEGTAIDGFGTAGVPWPTGLSTAVRWTGTEGTGGYTGRSWVVHGSGGNVNVVNVPQSDRNRVVCVP